MAGGLGQVRRALDQGELDEGLPGFHEVLEGDVAEQVLDLAQQGVRLAAQRALERVARGGERVDAGVRADFDTAGWMRRDRGK